MRTFQTPSKNLQHSIQRCPPSPSTHLRRSLEIITKFPGNTFAPRPNGNMKHVLPIERDSPNQCYNSTWQRSSRRLQVYLDYQFIPFRFYQLYYVVLLSMNQQSFYITNIQSSKLTLICFIIKDHWKLSSKQGARQLCS